jgi:hypothetical protein
VSFLPLIGITKFISFTYTNTHTHGRFHGHTPHVYTLKIIALFGSKLHHSFLNIFASKIHIFRVQGLPKTGPKFWFEITRHTHAHTPQNIATIWSHFSSTLYHSIPIICTSKIPQFIAQKLTKLVKISGGNATPKSVENLSKMLQFNILKHAHLSSKLHPSSCNIYATKMNILGTQI